MSAAPDADPRPEGEYEAPWDLQPQNNILRMKNSIKSRVKQANKEGNSKDGKKNSTYFALLNSIASDLEVMLNDLCHQFPYPTAATIPSCVPCEKVQKNLSQVRDNNVFEQYMSSASAAEEEDDVLSSGSDMFADRSESTTSSDGEFFSLEEDQTSDAAVAGTDLDSPPPLPPPPNPSCLAGLGLWDRREGGRSIPLLEKLIRTHPIWYLPNIGRVGAVHLLNNRQPGTFIVRQASKKDTMAMSVRLRQGPYIEHYLIESTPRGLKLEGSQSYFPAIPVLISHYCDYRNELPVQLVLPEAIMKAKTHQELSSLALLGQDFWTSAISRNKPTLRTVYHTTVNAPPPSSSCSQIRPAKSSFSTTNCVNGATTTATHTSLQNTVSTQSSSQVTRTMDCFQKVIETKTVSKTTQINGAIPTTTSSLTKTKGYELCFTNGALSSSLSSLDMISPKPKMTATKTKSAPFTSNEMSAFSAPSVTKAEPTTMVSQAPMYYKGRLSDKLSDYEDVWNAPSTAGSDIDTPFFRPIQNGSVTEEESVSLVSDAEATNHPNFSMVNPGYNSDTGSGTCKFTFLPGNKINLAEKHVETDHVEETHKVSLERIVPSGMKKDIPGSVSFSYGLPANTVSSLTPAGSFSRKRCSPPTTKAPPVPNNGRQNSTGINQFTSPAFAQPWDALIGKVDGATETTGAIKVSDYFLGKEHAAQSCVVPPKVPPRKESFHIRDQIPKLTSFHPASAAVTATPNPVYAEPVMSKARIQLKSASSVPKLSSSESEHDLSSSSSKVCTFGRSQSMRALAEEVEKPIHARAQSLPKEAPKKPVRLVKTTAMIQVTTVRVPITVPEEPIVQSLPQPQQAVPLGNFSSPRQKPPTPPKPKRLASPEKPSPSHPVPQRKPPPMSKSFEENFFKPEAIQRLEEAPKPYLRKFPVHCSQSSLGSFSDTSTVEDVISDVSPDLTLMPIRPLTVKNLQRISDYDNIHHRLLGAPSSRRTAVASSAGTQYCQPWDSNLWDNLINMPQPPPAQASPRPLTPSEVYQDAISEPSDDNSDADYSSVYYESESGTALSDRLGSDVCASTFEWGAKLDTHDSATEFTPRQPRAEASGMADLEDSVNEMTREPVSDDEGVEYDQDPDHDNFRDRLMPFLSTPRIIGMRNRGRQSSGLEVRDYVYGLAQKSQTTFGIMVEEFIKCTIEGNETNPQIVVANVRQFMNGIKNYLVQNGEAELNQMIETERSKLENDEFLNIDAIIEGALHKCIVKPLKQHIYKLFVNEYKKNGDLQTLSDNIKYARSKTPAELGIKPGLLPPQGASMEVIKHFITKMQKAYSPLKKLENLLGATSSIYNSIQSRSGGESSDSSSNKSVTMGADDFLPMFIYILVQCGMVSAEIEADYMWGLLHPCLLTGEGGYHLTTLSSAVHVLKNLKQTMETTVDLESSSLPSLGDLQGFMKIIIPNEKNDSIITKTLPVRPNMTTREVCSMIAHKFKITNPQDYGLCVLVAGIEDKLTENSCPQSIKKDLVIDGRECIFAYKRNNAKFAWPKSFIK